MLKWSEGLLPRDDAFLPAMIASRSKLSSLEPAESSPKPRPLRRKTAWFGCGVASRSVRRLKASEVSLDVASGQKQLILVIVELVTAVSPSWTLARTMRICEWSTGGEGESASLASRRVP